ncbi:hypothetical protein C6558_07015 [Ensifer sp. NM-2]|nr:hypothetical protein C6558_07015 [Ensifer sp. NM-2]
MHPENVDLRIIQISLNVLFETSVWRRTTLPNISLVIAMLALMAISGCATSGGGNTTYAQWQGSYPDPSFAAIRSGGVNPGY